MQEKEIICISCPLGCHLKVTGRRGQDITVTGNQCIRGEIYGKEEFLAPTRIVTAVVRTNSAKYPYVPVKTDRPVIRARIPELLRELYRIKTSIPIQCGDVIIENYDETEVKVICTRSISE
ncbi:MAG: DUF1667 domain-containing protein [Spirochaetales bacterium]|nr:DUF1667 domain-containing protein [Spirochaetales bacterium]